MTSKINQKVDAELAVFVEKMAEGFAPDAAFKSVLRRILKDQDLETRKACAKRVLETNTPEEASNACLDCDTFN